MNVNKKLDRFKQWAGERMGGEVKTNTSDEFKALETEMSLRHEGMDRMHKSMTLYVKSIAKRNEDLDGEKTLPIGHLGSIMAAHGNDFAPDSEFGSCLSAFGRASERIARVQEGYVANATSSWLESLERSLAQMKEYQSSRKKLEQRRLAYDTSLAKMQKQKREDFRVEEELRSQKAKYDESNEDVYRRMEDVTEAETESVVDLTAFLEAELAYHERCMEILIQLKHEWPARSHEEGKDGRKATRSRSNTAYGQTERSRYLEDQPMPELRAPIPRLSTRSISPIRGPISPTYSPRPTSKRSTTYTFEGPTSLSRDMSPVPKPRLSRVPTEPSIILANRSQLRPVHRVDSNEGVFDDQYDGSQNGYAESPRGQTPSPPMGYGMKPSRITSWSGAETTTIGGIKKAPPPPPPSRAKKPPPPPPIKRTALT